MFVKTSRRAKEIKTASELKPKKKEEKKKKVAPFRGCTKNEIAIRGKEWVLSPWINIPLLHAGVLSHA